MTERCCSKERWRISTISLTVSAPSQALLNMLFVLLNPLQVEKMPKMYLWKTSFAPVYGTNTAIGTQWSCLSAAPTGTPLKRMSIMFPGLSQETRFREICNIKPSPRVQRKLLAFLCEALDVFIWLRTLLPSACGQTVIHGVYLGWMILSHNKR